MNDEAVNTEEQSAMTEDQYESVADAARALSGAGTPDDVLHTPSGDIPMADVVIMTKADLQELVQSLREEYDAKIAEASSSFDKVKLQLEKQSNIRIAENQGNFRSPSLSVKQFGPKDMRSKIDEPYKKAHPDRFHWWTTNHPTLLPLRRAQGFEPVLDKNGQQVTDLDGILMSMPLAKAEEEILKPNRENRQRMRDAIGGEFKEQAADMGIEVFDDIKYDKIEEGSE